jgi:hypothetical protein
MQKPVPLILSKPIDWIGLLVALTFFSCNSTPQTTEPNEQKDSNKYLIIGKLDTLEFHVVNSVETPCWFVTRLRYTRLDSYIDSGSTCMDWGPGVGDIQDTLRKIESRISGSGFFEILLPNNRFDSTWNRQFMIYVMDELGAIQDGKIQGALPVEWTNRALYLPVHFFYDGPPRPNFFPPVAVGRFYRIELVKTGTWIAE